MEYKLRCGKKRKEKRANGRRGTGCGTYLVEEQAKKVEEATSCRGKGGAAREPRRVKDEQTG